jgi:hypothetical protein
LQLELLEDRIAPSVSVIEDFEAGSLSAYSTALRYAPSAVVLPIAGHDGLQGLVKQDGYEWMIREDDGSTVHEGDTVSVWTQFAGVADGRAYLGFDSHDIAPDHATLVTGGTLAVVMAANTNQLLIQNDSGGTAPNTGVANFNTVAAVDQSYQADHWYRLEAQWGAGGAITANLYDSDGTTLLSTVSGNTTAPFPDGGGIAFRGFGHDKYFDTVVLDSGSAGAPADRVAVDPGLDPSWVPGNPPAPVANGPYGNPAPVPWEYTSTPGSGIEVTLNSFNALQQVAMVGDTISGTVALSAASTAANTGAKQIGWADPLETPLLAQYLFRQRPGEATQLIGASSLRHFSTSTHTDAQHLNPTETSSATAIQNGTQTQYTYGSELDPVTGTLHSSIDRTGTDGSLSDDGMFITGSRTFPSPIDQLLQVSIGDLDPDRNPAGTRWFLMGNLFVAGQDDVTQASRWVEIVPTLSSGTFFFTYPSGTGGHPDFHTIPGLIPNTGFVAISFSPTGSLMGPVNHVHVVFNQSVDVTTFTPAQVSLFDSHGNPVTITSITDIGSADHSQFDINFAPQGSAGNYLVTLSNAIQDQSGDHLAGQTTGELVVNAGFETGDFTGWTQSGDLSSSSVDGFFDGTPPHGARFQAVFGPVFDLGFITQNVPTVMGTNYTLSFWLAHPYDDAGTEWLVRVGGATLRDVHDAANFGYTQFTFMFTATSNFTAIQFGFHEPFNYFFLDDISVTAPVLVADRFTLTSPAIVATTPADGQVVTAPFNHVRVTFDRPMDPATVASANISLTGPGGAIPLSFAAAGLSNTVFDITFANQGAAGGYTLMIGAGVQDPSGNPITSSLTEQFTITSPAVVSTTPGAGGVSAPFNHVRVTFSRPMDPLTVIPPNITLTGPGGDIPLTITAVGTGTTQFDITFDDQTDLGSYTLAISTGVQDTFGNPITAFAPRVFTVGILANGDFETGNFNGWTQSGDQGGTGVAGSFAGTDPHGGSFQGFFGPSGGLGFISQNLNTTVGVSYTLSFWLAHPYTDMGMGTEWLVSVGGATLMDVHDADYFGYTQFTFTFTATSTSTPLQFGFVEPPSYFFLDDVSVTPT